MRLCFDLETTPIPDGPGALPDTVWCIVAIDVDTGEEFTATWRPVQGSTGDMAAMQALLERADLLIGHNIAKFDVPVLEEHFAFKRTGRLLDTLSASRLVYASNRMEVLGKFRDKGTRSEAEREARLPQKLMRKPHALETWGYLVGHRKLHTDVGVDFYRQYSAELLERCVEDVRLNVKVFRHLTTRPAEKGWALTPAEAMITESEFEYLLGLAERNGVGFDSVKAQALARVLEAERAVLERDLRQLFPAWLAPESGQKGEGLPFRTGDAGYTVCKRDRTMKPTDERPWPATYVEGAAYTKVSLVDFNPASGHHRAEVLQRKYGWKPMKFTDGGEPETSEEVLAALEYPEIPMMLRAMTVDKRLGQVAHGKEAWLKHVTPAGKIHGRVMATGTRTGRCSHSKPNLGQVPRMDADYGPECRGLYRPTRPDWVLVGIDAKALQLRLLGHRLAYYDDGAFGEVLLNGDPHESWRQATGMPTRDGQKECTYAFIFGAGNEKLGQIMLYDWRKAYAAGTMKDKPPRGGSEIDLGTRIKRGLLRNVPGLSLLLAEGKRVRQERGWFVGLDGRVMQMKADHTVLADLLQNDEAVVMRTALLILDTKLRALQLFHGKHFAYALNVHDEWQIECEPRYAETIGLAGGEAIREAGWALNVRVVLDGNWKTGATWAETH